MKTKYNRPVGAQAFAFLSFKMHHKKTDVNKKLFPVPADASIVYNIQTNVAWTLTCSHSGINNNNGNDNDDDNDNNNSNNDDDDNSSSNNNNNNHNTTTVTRETTIAK